MSDIDITGKDRILAVYEDEEVTIFNHISVNRGYYINSVNGHDTYLNTISRGDMAGSARPEYITPRLDEYLYDEFSIDVTNHGIEVLDPESEDVQLV